MEIEVISAITLGAVILSSVVNVVGLVSKRDAQVSAEAKRDVKLDNILERMEGFSTHQNAVEEAVKAQGERLTIVEQSNKSLWHKVDDLYSEHRERHYKEVK